jgi:murein DD-endopeptidase MepM/ murein hydrolase activator NlpD
MVSLIFILLSILLLLNVGDSFSVQTKKGDSQSKVDTTKDSTKKSKKSTSKKKTTSRKTTRRTSTKESERKLCDYKVVKGDTPGRVAEKFGMSIEELKKVNNVRKKKFVLVAGKSIKVYCKQEEKTEKQEKIEKEAKTTYCSYKVKKRVESIEEISKNLGVDVEELARINKVKETAKFRKGRLVNVPCEYLEKFSDKSKRKVIVGKESTKEREIVEKRELESKTKLCEYKVKEGDTLYSISRLTGTTPEKLIELNSITENKIVVGQVLKVPCGVGIPSKEEEKQAKLQQREESEKVITEERKASKERVFSKATPVSEKKILLLKSFSVRNHSFISPIGKEVDAVIVSNRVDIPVNKGEKIVAVADGQVVYATNNIAGVASLLVVKHGSLYSVYSGENIELRVKNGDKVRQGDVIGETKSSTILRFQIRDKKEAIDPAQYAAGKRG